MTSMLRIRMFQVGVLVLAALSALIFVHWFVVQPAPLVPREHELAFLTDIVFRPNTAWAGYAAYLEITLGLMAVTGLTASALSAVLALKVAEQIAARRLAWSLVFGSLSAAYFFFVTTHTEYRAAIGWRPDTLLRFTLDLAAYGIGLLSPVFLARFFISYPRSATADEWEAFFQRQIASAREAIRGGGWRDWFYPASLRTRWANSRGENKWFRFTLDANHAHRQYRTIGFAKANAVFFVATGWAILCATIDWLDASQAGGTSVAGAVFLMKMVLSGLVILAPIFAWEVATNSLQMHAESMLAEDRRKIDWIKSTLLIGGVLVITLHLGGTALSFFLMNFLANRDIFIPGGILMFGPFFAAIQLLVLAFVVALALSIFYRGAIDPRLAARKITVFGVLGLAVAFLFVLFERTVAMKIVAFFNLSPDTGALIAGASVAATIAPIKTRAEKVINVLVGRYLPLDSLIEGERRTMAVALSDLSGYTSLSSRDEKHALLLAAFLQRQAHKITETHGGRVVKSMGDAILFAFDDATTAVKVLSTLHRDFASGAEQLGLAALPVHSGAHWGEVTVAQDDDLYGQTVNIAARIQGAAAPGQIVVSDTFAAAAGGAGYRDLGPRQFKNVPQPVACLELTMPSVLPSVATTATA